MGFKRLETQDFILNNSAVTSPMWSGNVPTLNNYFTSSTQINSNVGAFYTSVFDKTPLTSNSEIQFSIAYCDLKGSGSMLYNPIVDGASPSRSNYGQYKNLILGEDEGFIFGNFESPNFYALAIERARFKEKILPGTMTLHLSGSGGLLTLTDDSKKVQNLSFGAAGRVFNLISGSAGELHSGLNPNGWSGGALATSGSYGWLLPDIGVILLNPNALKPSLSDGGIALNTQRSSNTNDQNSLQIFEALQEAGWDSKGWTLNSEETISSNYLYIRARNDEFNFSENPSYVSGSTGAVLFDSFIDDPKTYITTIGLYNDNNELLAVSRLSRPLRKDSTHEALVRIKLDF